MLAAIVLAIILALVVLWRAPQLQVRSYQRRYPLLAAAELMKGENDFRATLAQVIGGVAVLAGLYFTATTFRLQQEGQITDRINKAVEQLGSDKPDVSLGGVYQIARIADDSDRDHWPMMQVLMSYVERRAPLPDLGPDARQQQCAPNSRYDSSETPDYNVQAVANVIRTRKSDTETSDQQVSIVHAKLRFIDLRGANMKGAKLIGNDMLGAALSDALLDGGSQLNYSLLNHANLTDTHLSNANLYHACLVRSQLTGADFKRAHLQYADLRNVVDASGADFTDAELENADFRGADVSKAKGLKAEQFAAVRIDCYTQLPSNLASVKSVLKCEGE
jgi:hypothetical protein